MAIKDAETWGGGGQEAPPFPSWPLLLVSLIIVAYLIIGLQYALLTPRWQVPDEPAHYNYIRYLVENRSLPALDPGEYQQSYLEKLKSEGFPAELPIDSLQYESWQPPLYYLLASPIYLISNGALLPLRLLSLVIGAGVIVFAYLAVRESVGSNHIGLPLLAAGFVAFIPQHVAIMAGINNDSLSELWIAIGLWLILRLNNRAWDLGFWLLGFITGLAFITKSQAYVLAPVAGLMLLFRWRREGWGQWRSLVKRTLIIFVPALLMGAWVWGRNLELYGWPDFMAAIRHDQVVADQPRTAQWVAEFGRTEVARRFLQTTFQSFWGQFGWMGVVMDGRVYGALGIFTVGLVVGVVIRDWRVESKNLHSPLSTLQFESRLLLLLSGLLTLALYLYYNLTYVQHQGRYLFPALIPIGLAAAVGLSGWGRILSRLVRRNIGWIVGAGALAGMAALDVFALYRFILPALR